MQPDRAAKRENRDRPTSNTEHGTEVIAISSAAKHYFSGSVVFPLIPFPEARLRMLHEAGITLRLVHPFSSWALLHTLQRMAAH